MFACGHQSTNPSYTSVDVSEMFSYFLSRLGVNTLAFSLCREMSEMRRLELSAVSWRKLNTIDARSWESSSESRSCWL